MNNTRTFDAVILGAGIGGLSVADALLQKGLSCCVVDTGSPGSGASGAPLMLVNPATGRRAKMAWNAAECLNSILDLLERVQTHSGSHFYEPGSILRPALSPSIADDFKQSPAKYNWPEPDWVRWLEPEEFFEQYPYFGKNHGGLVVKHGATVDGSRFIRGLSNYLSYKGLETLYNKDYKLIKRDEHWLLECEDGDSIKCDKLIFATGRVVTESPLWQYLPLNLIKGQTATAQFDTGLPLRNSVSSMGYLAYLDQTPNKVVIGSTYEHHFDHLNPDPDGLNRLLKKLDTTLPGYRDHITSIEQWAAVRVSSKDHKPVVGQHIEEKNLYILTALGSKGLLTGRCLAGYLAGLIVSNKPITREVSAERYYVV